jgi:hypothetical protein
MLYNDYRINFAFLWHEELENSCINFKTINNVPVLGSEYNT